MLGPFKEDYASDQADPIDGRTQDFDLRAVEVGLGEAQAEEPITPTQQAAEAIGVLLRFISADALRLESITPVEAIGRRALALVWTIRPDLLDGHSLAELARRSKLPKQALSVLAARVHRTFGIANRSQEAHGRVKFERGLEAHQEPELQTEATE